MLDGMAREPNQSDDLFVPVDAIARPLPADIKLPPSKLFPTPTATTAEGLLCVGGRLAPEWLLDAYRHGIFPWPMWDDDPIACRADKSRRPFADRHRSLVAMGRQRRR